MSSDFDILETAQICRRSTESRIDEDLCDIIKSYGEQTFMAAIMRHPIADTFFSHASPNQMKAVIWVLIEIISSDRPRLTAECIALATGMLSDESITMTQVAKRHGMTKANVSRRVLKLSDKLKMTPSTAMKTRKQRATYRLTNGAIRKKV